MRLMLRLLQPLLGHLIFNSWLQCFNFRTQAQALEMPLPQLALLDFQELALRISAVGVEGARVCYHVGAALGEIARVSLLDVPINQIIVGISTTQQLLIVLFELFQSFPVHFFKMIIIINFLKNNAAEACIAYFRFSLFYF